MGDTKKQSNKSNAPMHPWRKERIESEKTLINEYGLKTKSEIWKHASQIKRFIEKYKDTTIRNPAQAQKERDELVEKMVRIGLINRGDQDDIILGMGVRNMLDRRLQTMIVKRKLARTMKQARQLIVHRHIQVAGRVLTSPAYIVPVAEEDSLAFTPRSAMFNEQHPERAVVKESKAKKHEATQPVEETPVVEAEAVQIEGEVVAEEAE